LKLLSLFRYQKKLLDAFNPAEKREYTQLIVLSFGSILLELLGQAILFVILMIVLDYDLVQNYMHQLFGGLNYSPVVLIAVLALSFLLKNIALIGLSKLQLKKLFGITSTLSSDLYIGTFSADLKTFKKVVSGERLNEITSITNSLPNFVILPSITAMTELIFMVLVLIILAIIKPFLIVLLVLFLLPPTLIFLWLGRKRLDKYGRYLTEAMPRLYESVSHSVLGFSEIKLFNLQQQYLKNFEEVREEIYENRIKSQIISGIAPQRLMEVLAVFGILVMAWYFREVNPMVNVNAILALFASVAFRLLPSLNRIVSSLNTFATFSNILEFIPKTRKTELVKPIVDFDIFKSLNISSLSFSFDDQHKVLNNLSLEIVKGDFIGIYGESGQGKTTLVNALLGFYKIENNLMTINGLEFNDVLPEWHKHIGYVKQEAFLLSGSIESNIAFGEKQVDQHKLNRVIDQVRLTAWVDSLPKGVQTHIGEQGSQISGGQRQRIALARALYKEVEFLVFDEATNALDEKTKNEIWSTMADLNKQGKTMVLVSHDLEAFRYCSKRYELINGQLVSR